MQNKDGIASISRYKTLETAGMTKIQNAVDKTVLQTLEPIASLSTERVEELAALCFVEKIPAGITLFHAGDNDNQTVYLLKGEVILSDKGVKQLSLLGSSEDAQYAIADKQPRQLSATTETNVDVLRIDNDLLDIMLTWDQLTQYEADVEMHSDKKPDGKKEDWMGAMGKTSAFKTLPPANIEKLLARMEKMSVKNTQAIIRQGEEGDYYYLIESGKASVTRQIENGDSKELAQLGPGACFGEEALVSDAKRNATVIMISDGVLLRLAKKDFVELLREPLLNWVTQQEAVAKIKSGRAKWLDVRHVKEYQHARVPGAMLCPLHELRNRAGSLDRDLEYVCYCKTGRRSSAAAFLLSQRGFKAFVLKGGLQTLPD
jgi:CRP-like cAMP-binding protein